MDPKRTEKKEKMTVAGRSQVGFPVINCYLATRYRELVYYTSDKTNFKRMNRKVDCNEDVEKEMSQSV